MLAIVVSADGFGHCDQRRYAQLDENAVDILDQVQDQLQQAQELTEFFPTYINETAQQMLDDETLSLKTLDFQQQRQPAAAAGCSPQDA